MMAKKFPKFVRHKSTDCINYVKPKEEKAWVIPSCVLDLLTQKNEGRENHKTKNILRFDFEKKNKFV